MKKILFFYTFFAAITLFAQNVSLDLTASSGTYTVPQGVTSITVEAWGGGGGGGGAKATGYIFVWQTRSGSGGGGSAYARSIIAAPFSSPYNITVGAGGTSGQNADGGNGGDTSFGNIVKAAGGKGGKRNAGTAGAGGDSGTSIGNNKYSGGNGAAGDNAFFEYGGGGGGSAGGGGVGGSASQSTGGTAGVAGGFSAGAAGAAGATNGINGTPGSAGTVPGSGGSGGKIIAVGGTYSVAGGAGAKGLIKISFAKPVISISPSAITICRGASATLTASSAGAYTYTWSNDAGSGATVSVSPTTTTTYTVTGTAPDGAGGTFTNTQTITVNVVDPVADITFTQTSYPSGATACNLQYMEITTNLPVSYSPATGLFTNTTLTTPYTGGNVTEIFAAPTGSVTYTATASNGYCSKTNTVTVVRTPVTPVSITSTVFPNGADACTLDYVLLTANQVAVFSPTTGLYTNTALTTLYTGTPVTTVYAAPNGAQSYTASVTSGSCSSVSSSVSVSRDKKVFLPSTGTWKKTSNWFPDGEPNADKCVRIPNGKTVKVNTDAFAKSLEVENGAGITIEEDQSLTVTQNITNLGDGSNFTVASDANLIQIEDNAVNTGSITAERLVSDINNISTHMDYLYWSAPVSGQGLKAFSPGTPDNRIFQYNEPNDLFKAVPLATEPNFVPGKGYAFRAESGTGILNPYSKTYKFKGVPNNGLIEREVQRSPNTGAAANVVHGYNLIGNPYPSNMSFEQFYQLNKNVIYNTAWFWTNNFFTPNQEGSGYGQNNYAVWNGTGGVAATTTTPADSNPENSTSNTTTPNGIVTVGQGFIVQVKNLGLGQKVQFRNRNGNTPLRVSTSGTFFSRQNEEKDRFWLKLISADSIVNSQLIGYIDGATNGFEQDYDAELMGMSSDVFYSLLEDRRLQIQGKAAFDPSDKVQLGANIFKNGTYTIAIENPEGIFNAGQKVYLKDNLLNRWVDLNAQAYTFEATKGITEGRFEIVYESPTVLATDAVTKDELMVYRDSGDFVVKAKSKKITSLEVYDGSGRLVYTTRPNDTKVVITGDRLNRGVYILKISQDGVVTAKKILK